MIRELTREDYAALSTIFKKERGQIAKSSDDRYRLTEPQNTWDMNYHLIDMHNGVEYLIDTDDIGFDDYESYHEDDLEYINVFYIDMLDLDRNVDMIIEASWKSFYRYE